MATVAQVISRAFQLLGVEELNETLDTAFYTDALYALNEMLHQMSIEFNLPVNTTEIAHTLTANDESYTIGSGADIDTTRPVAILNAYFRDGDIDYPLEVIPKVEYDRIAKKDVYGLPQYVCYDPAYANGTIYLCPGPDSAYSLRLVAPTKFAAYTATTETFALPDEFMGMVSYNLAVNLAPSFNVSIQQEVAARATRYLNNIKRLHSRPVRRLRTNPISTGRSWDYRTGF